MRSGPTVTHNMPVALWNSISRMKRFSGSLLVLYGRFRRFFKPARKKNTAIAYQSKVHLRSDFMCTGRALSFQSPPLAT